MLFVGKTGAAGCVGTAAGIGWLEKAEKSAKPGSLLPSATRADDTRHQGPTGAQGDMAHDVLQQHYSGNDNAFLTFYYY